MVEAASFVRTVSITGLESGVGMEVVAETEPSEGWEDKYATQTQREVWWDDEDEETSGRGGIGGDSDAEVDQTQRTDNDDNDDDGSDGDNSEVGSSSSSSASNSVATILYDDVVLLSLVRHNPVVKFRMMIFDTKSKLMGFFHD